jgi:hypothetical protein
MTANSRQVPGLRRAPRPHLVIEHNIGEQLGLVLGDVVLIVPEELVEAADSLISTWPYVEIKLWPNRRVSNSRTSPRSTHVFLVQSRAGPIWRPACSEPRSGHAMIWL